MFQTAGQRSGIGLETKNLETVVPGLPEGDADRANFQTKVRPVFLYTENPAIVAGLGRGSADEEDKRTPIVLKWKGPASQEENTIGGYYGERVQKHHK